MYGIHSLLLPTVVLLFSVTTIGKVRCIQLSKNYEKITRDSVKGWFAPKCRVRALPHILSFDVPGQTKPTNQLTAPQ